MKLGEDIIGQSATARFFRVADPEAVGIEPPPLRRGDALRTWVRSLSGFQKEALIASARTGHVWRLVSDEGAYLNGHDAAPCPLAFLTCGMVASYLGEIEALAAREGVRLGRLTLTQDNYYTMQGSMRDRSMTGGALPVELEVACETDLDDAALTELLTNAVHASPLNGLMRRRLPSLFALSRNGEEVPPAKARRLDGALLPDPGVAAARAEAEPSDLALMERTGTTPRKEVTKGTAAGGSSLADHQDRVLNPAAVATRREDGLLQIDQLLYSPHGSTFRFLSSEDGRAPDAATLISAGIAFCFMTQFGRFASMLKLDLPEYRIVQDTHFSLGGATGGTGKPGEADPVETHVHLTTSEDEAVAQEMLDISEQTCFLHALCRTELKTRLRVKRL